MMSWYGSSLSMSMKVNLRLCDLFQSAVLGKNEYKQMDCYCDHAGERITWYCRGDNAPSPLNLIRTCTISKRL